MPTRIKHRSATLIDHIWLNKISNNFKSGILINSLSDHFPVFYIEETKQNKINQPEMSRRNINNKTISSFCNLLKSTSWLNIITDKTPKTAFDSFFEKISAAVDESFPLIKVKPKPIRFSHSPWMTAGLFIPH